VPTNLKIAPRRLSFAAAAFVLLAAVNADAQSPARSSVVVPPIPSGQARVWIYTGSQPAPPNYYSHVDGVTLNGVKVGYEQVGGGFYRNVAPGHYVVAVTGLGLDTDESAAVDLAAGQEAYLKITEAEWPGGGENMAHVDSVHLMPHQETFNFSDRTDSGTRSATAGVTGMRDAGTLQGETREFREQHIRGVRVLGIHVDGAIVAAKSNPLPTSPDT
jgi:hypothetical protein